MRTDLLLGICASLLVPACKGSQASPGFVVPPEDTVDSGFPLDPNEIVPSAAFTDFGAETAQAIQTFLAHNPYNGASFLSTYQSNGVLFSAAVASAATKFRINPIVLLVAVEAQGALVDDTAYPPVTEVSVDYLFGCGCSVASVLATCDAASAGLDVQVGCLADQLRTSLDQIGASGQTAGGWAPGKTSATVDGKQVTPKDDSTAALYEFDPRVGSGTSGNLLFEAIWLEYTLAFSYGVPLGANPGATALVGDPCVAASDCGFVHPICATGASYPGGMCTSKCKGSCPGQDAFCADFTQGGYCLTLCNPTVPASCRAGYSCALVQPSGAPAGASAANVCVPK